MKRLQNTKFITFLFSLTQEQKSSFTKYLKQHHHADTLIYKIYNFLTILHPTHSYQTCEDLAETYPANISTKAMANYLSLLYTTAESWMVSQELSSNPAVRDKLTSQWLYKQGLNPLAYRLSSEKQSDGFDIHLKNLYISQLDKLNTIRYFHFDQIDDHYQFIKDIAQTNGQLYIYTNQLLKIELEALRQIKSHDPDLLMEQIDESLDAIEPFSPTSCILRDLHILLTHDDVEMFDYYLERMTTKQLLYDDLLLYFCYIVLHKVAARLYQRGKLKDNNVFMKIINFGLDEGITLQHHKLGVSHFHNLINRISLTQDLPTTTEFIKKWISKVETKFPQETYTLAIMQNHFFHSDFEPIQKLPPIAAFENFDQKHISLSIQLGINFMYRSRQPNLFEISCDQYASLLKRNKKHMSSAIFQSGINYLRFLSSKEEKTEALLASYMPILYKSFCQCIVAKSPTH